MINDREEDNYKCQARGNKNSYRATFRKVTERLRSCYKKLLAIASQRWNGEK